MFNRDKIESLAQEISGKLPPIFQQFKTETEATLRQVLHSFFNKLDLVTREEFDAQKQVLLRTRQKLEALEAEVAKLELRSGKGDETRIDDL
ncbi:MAG: accessory factor UbiK family protein [Gammaproteobacteria bacterium]|nr:accessory factor UbiK family protein [Gammaproteobacteria bacterium]